MEMLQRSDEWFSDRLGKLTSSRIADATAKVKSGESAARANYRAQLVAERLTGISQSPDLSWSKSIRWGVDMERAAKDTYQFITDNEVLSIGFVDHPIIEMSGASPDGLIGRDGLIEIKCPNTATHIDYLKSGNIPSNYQKQMTWQLACTKKKWCDFVSFDPRLNIENQLLIIRFEPSDLDILALEDEAVSFLNEVSETELWLRNRKMKIV